MSGENANLAEADAMAAQKPADPAKPYANMTAAFHEFIYLMTLLKWPSTICQYVGIAKVKQNSYPANDINM